jgi:1-phosphatidylinositol-3-phosphate 5-kinase
VVKLGQIFCGKCASHIISGKQFKQKGEVRVCNFCFENIDQNIVENNSAISLGSLAVESAAIGNFSPVVPDQKAPIAAPKLQISTTALKQSRDSYGDQDTPTVAVEFQNEFGTNGPETIDNFKAFDLLSPTDNPIVRQTHRLSEHDEHEPRPIRSESTSSIPPRMRTSTTGSQASFDERQEFASMAARSPFPFRSEIASPALEAVPNRAGSDSGGSPLIEKYEDENDDSGALWSTSKNPHIGDLSANAFGLYKVQEPGSPSASASDLKGHEGNASDRSIFSQYSDNGTNAKHKLNRRLSYSVSGRRSSHNRRSPLWRNMRSMKIDTHNLTRTNSESPRSEDTVSTDSQFMLFSPFIRTEPFAWPTADGLGIPTTRTNSQPIESAASPSLQMHSELSIASLDHLKGLLHQSLTNLKYLQDQPTVLTQYENIIFDLLLEMVASIKPDIRNGDDMDLRHYIKIKKIPGGTPKDSTYVKGVMCSKNVAHKQMIRNVDDPKILILLFPVEYSRVGNQLLSLEPVLSQEKEHLKKLVARIIALKPSIVLTKFNVSRLALEYLLAENIIVVHNMKKSVLQAIARCTGASLIPSIDKFTSGELSLGHCGRFEIKTLVHEMIPNRRKTYMIFDQCSPELGGTIVLRGADQSTLTSIKRIVDFTCYMIHSLKLETFLLRDSFAKSKIRADAGTIDSNTDANVLRNASNSLSSFSSISNLELNNSNCATTTPIISVENADELSNSDQPSALAGLRPTETEERYMSIDASIQLYKEAIVSISPFVVIPPPYLLTKIKEIELNILEVERLMALDETQHERIITPGSTTPVSATFEQKPESALISQGIIHAEAVTSPLKDELDLLLDQRYQMTRAWYASMPDMFSHLTAYHHQHLIVLYFNVCTATTVPCHGPEPLFFQYYSQSSDITLGHYLEDLCWHAERKCSSSMCARPDILHYRSYVHGQARINVMIENFECPQPGMADIILMWSYCKRCNNPTPVVPMSQNTWNYSFGKFLELSLYQTDVQCRADICPHDIARDHVRYFGFKNLAVRFQYDEIDLLEVAPPPMKLVMFTKVHSKLREDQYQNYRTKITSFYHSITERNKHFNMEIIDSAKVDTAKKELAEMSETAAAEKKAMLQALQSVYATTYSTDILSLNQIVIHLVRNASIWDQTYSNLLRRYLPQDNDLGKIASSSLRKFLPTDKVIDMDARAERAIGTFDLPVLGVGLDSIPMSKAYDAQSTLPDEDDIPSTVPMLGSSPKQHGINIKDENSDIIALKDNINLPSSLSRRLSLELIKSEAERAVEPEKEITGRESPLPLVDLSSSSIISRRQAKFLAKRSRQAGDAMAKPTSIPGLILLPETGAGSSIRRKEHPIFSVIQDSPLSVATPNAKASNQMSTNSLITGNMAEQLREPSSKSTQIAPSGNNGDAVSRSPYSYLPRYVDQLHKRSEPSMRDVHTTSTARRKWGHKLKHSRTSIQVYDTAKDLVTEDVEQEFGDDLLTPELNTFGSLVYGAGATPRLDKIDQLLPSRLTSAATRYRQIEPRTDYFDNASPLHNNELGRLTNTPSSPRSITNFSIETAPIEQHIQGRSQEAPLSSSPTIIPTKEENSGTDVDDLALETGEGSTPSSHKEISHLLDEPSGGSDQTMFMKALSTALAEITFSKLPALEYPL